MDDWDGSRERERVGREGFGELREDVNEDKY